MENLIKTKFYTFQQNNPGGSNIRYDELGIADWIIVEAESANEAVDWFSRLEEQYEFETDKTFDGSCSCGICSGNRWECRFYIEDDDATDEPMILNKKAGAYQPPYWDEACYIHYKNGEIIRLELKSK